ncbi:Leucine Rich Repeat [Seminavis robusta]|uniref:Leucine Rich Repeat n=1 Tax=Seminavis robusta TaxID=568900 RepID=A0A9N8DWN8_9STRA|nr:Leucine Rich Repeat [Seminavis robusta]|eukprot:Sro417_g138810.1 Leucine Rich Repeat (680) ;mRNA; r:62652-64927
MAGSKPNEQDLLLRIASERASGLSGAEGGIQHVHNTSASCQTTISSAPVNKALDLEACGSDDHDDEILKVVQMRLQQHRAENRQKSLGLLAVDGNRIPEQGSTTRDPLPGSDNPAGLAVANMVEHTDIPTALPHTAVNDTDTSRMRREQTKQFKTTILLGVLFVIVCIVVVVAILVPSDDHQSTDANPTIPLKSSSNSTQAPTQAPTSLEDSIFSLLPNETVARILKDRDSPQSMAFDWLMEDGELPSYSNEQIMQKFALVALFHATAGERWYDNTNWLKHNVSECEWYSNPDFAQMGNWRRLLGEGFLRDFFPPTEPAPTMCNEDGIYEHLWLDHNNLGGTLPEEFYLMTSLKTFSAGGNHLEGSISTRVGQLSKLEGFGVTDVTNVGVIPSELGLLSRLRLLSLNENDHTGSIPSELWLLTNLDSMLVFNSPRLKFSIPTEIGNFKRLRWLAASNFGISGTIPSEIGTATSLELLSCGENKLTGTLPSEIAQLTKLHVLALWENNLRGTIPTGLERMTDMFVLDMSGNQLTGTVHTELGLLTGLSVNFNFEGNHLTGTIPSELGLLSLAIELELSNNLLLGKIPSEFGQLSSMGRLAFANNSLLSGTVPHELSALQEVLHTIYLEGNPELSGTIPQGVCDMNGTCVGTAYDPCEGPYGLYFECTGFLCGCGCPCLDG